MLILGLHCNDADQHKQSRCQTLLLSWQKHVALDSAKYNTWKCDCVAVRIFACTRIPLSLPHACTTITTMDLHTTPNVCKNTHTAKWQTGEVHTNHLANSNMSSRHGASHTGLPKQRVRHTKAQHKDTYRVLQQGAHRHQAALKVPWAVQFALQSETCPAWPDTKESVNPNKRNMKHWQRNRQTTTLKASFSRTKWKGYGH